ncbi:hypothetical protein [Pseudomonas cerasi]
MDKKAKNILFKTYWGSSGWLSEQKTTAEDFAYARSQGVMFNPVSLTHDECLEEVLAMAKRISPTKAAHAFLASLSAKRLDWRSGVASYTLARQMAPHHYAPIVSGQRFRPDGSLWSTSHTCTVCRDVVPGLTIGAERYVDEDLNVLNFERIKWGGIRHGQLIYTWFDLQELERADIPQPTDEDIAILRSILSTIESSLATDHAGALEKQLATVVKASKDERRTFINILAHLDVLRPASFDRPRHGKSDWSAAAAAWRGEDKYDRKAVHLHFGEWLCR